MDSHPDSGRIRLPQPKNSAGRSLPVAISVGVGLGALVIACLVIPYAWYPLLSLIHI